MEKLSSCPWCGGREVDVKYFLTGYHSQPVDFQVVCLCGAKGPFCDNEHFAIARWNQQAKKGHKQMTANPRLGEKFDAGKLPIHLIAPEMIEALAARLAIGAKKHADRNWEKGLMYSRCFSAAQRHLWAWWGGEEFDPDPDVPEASSHIDAALINIAFLVAFNRRKRTDLDDRS